MIPSGLTRSRGQELFSVKGQMAVVHCWSRCSCHTYTTPTMHNLETNACTCVLGKPHVNCRYRPRLHLTDASLDAQDCALCEAACE